MRVMAEIDDAEESRGRLHRVVCNLGGGEYETEAIDG